jgi:hypothetical protein
MKKILLFSFSFLWITPILLLAQANTIEEPDTITVSSAIENLSTLDGKEVFIIGYLNKVFELTALTNFPEDFLNRFQNNASYRKLIRINNYKHNAIFIKGMDEVIYSQVFGGHIIRRQFKGYRNKIGERHYFLFGDLPNKVLMKGILLKDKHGMVGALLLDVEQIIFIE